MTFDELNQPIGDGLSLMVRGLQKQYHDVLINIFEKEKLEFLVRRAPIDELAGYLTSLEKVGFDAGVKAPASRICSGTNCSMPLADNHTDELCNYCKKNQLKAAA